MEDINEDIIFHLLTYFLDNTLHFHRPLQTLTNDQNPHREASGIIYTLQMGDAMQNSWVMHLRPQRKSY